MIITVLRAAALLICKGRRSHCLSSELDIALRAVGDGNDALYSAITGTVGEMVFCRDILLTHPFRKVIAQGPRYDIFRFKAHGDPSTSGKILLPAVRPCSEFMVRKTRKCQSCRSAPYSSHRKYNVAPLEQSFITASYMNAQPLGRNVD